MLPLLPFLLALALVHAEEPLPYRTDADGPVVKKVLREGKPLPWFQLVEGQFPPEGSAHRISGELIRVDHLERTFHLRVDRNDSQDRGVWDIPLPAAMLPYGAIWYRGAPAALEDIPLHTHLHGLFYEQRPGDKPPELGTAFGRKSPEGTFGRCLQLEDDFTARSRMQQLWTIQRVDWAAMKLTAALPSAPPQTFDLLTSTQVFEGRSFAELKAIQPGMQVLLNLTWATLYGPGRITEVWLDQTARSLATAQQLEKHRIHTRERGLPGWVTAVDDEQEWVTVLLFGNVDPALLEEIQLPPSPAQPPKEGSPPPPEAQGRLAVARESLMTYDPVNDSKTARLLDLTKTPAPTGSSGVEIRVKVGMMLEGYRPRRIVRFFPPSWPVRALPQEEQFFGRE